MEQTGIWGVSRPSGIPSVPISIQRQLFQWVWKKEPASVHVLDETEAASSALSCNGVLQSPTECSAFNPSGFSAMFY